mmetsp:Transcript_31261/g.75586  ORF Transcript_31261/g.75586 Transcript_31261/m.75586 type:complete len:211 (-) Transcript_31261:201-833(-)
MRPFSFLGRYARTAGLHIRLCMMYAALHFVRPIMVMLLLLLLMLFRSSILAALAAAAPIRLRLGRTTTPAVVQFRCPTLRALAALAPGGCSIVAVIDNAIRAVVYRWSARGRQGIMVLAGFVDKRIRHRCRHHLRMCSPGSVRKRRGSFRHVVLFLLNRMLYTNKARCWHVSDGPRRVGFRISPPGYCSFWSGSGSRGWRRRLRCPREGF